jgi:surfactin synthase thioesterase subunit
LAIEIDELKWFVSYNQTVPPMECEFVTLGLASPGNGTGIWNQIARLIPDESIFGIRSPGRENRSEEQPFSRMPDFVSACTDAIEAVFQKCRSIRLVSFCLSAKIVVMIAAEIEARRPSCKVELVLIEPNIWVPETQVPWLELTLQEIAVKLREQSMIPAIILSDLDVLSFFAPMIAADFALTENYEIPGIVTLSADICIINTRHSGIDDGELRTRCKSITTGEISFRDVESPTSLAYCPTVVADTLIGSFGSRS